eukprot:jgi/Botrbrau1/20233/Bobra.31_1s0028.2
MDSCETPLFRSRRGLTFQGGIPFPSLTPWAVQKPLTPASVQTSAGAKVEFPYILAEQNESSSMLRPCVSPGSQGNSQVEEDAEETKALSQAKAFLLEAKSPLWPSLATPGVTRRPSDVSQCSEGLLNELPGTSTYHVTSFQRRASRTKVMATVSSIVTGSPAPDPVLSSETPQQQHGLGTDAFHGAHDLSVQSGQRLTGGRLSRLRFQSGTHAAVDSLSNAKASPVDSMGLGRHLSLFGAEPPVQTYNLWSAHSDSPQGDVGGSPAAFSHISTLGEEPARAQLLLNWRATDSGPVPLTSTFTARNEPCSTSAATPAGPAGFTVRYSSKKEIQKGIAHGVCLDPFPEGLSSQAPGHRKSLLPLAGRRAQGAGCLQISTGSGVHPSWRLQPQTHGTSLQLSSSSQLQDLAMSSRDAKIEAGTSHDAELDMGGSGRHSSREEDEGSYVMVSFSDVDDQGLIGEKASAARDLATGQLDGGHDAPSGALDLSEARRHLSLLGVVAVRGPTIDNNLSTAELPKFLSNDEAIGRAFARLKLLTGEAAALLLPMKVLEPLSTTAVVEVEIDTAEQESSTLTDPEAGWMKSSKSRPHKSSAGGQLAAQRLKKMAALQLEGARLTAALGLA